MKEIEKNDRKSRFVRLDDPELAEELLEVSDGGAGAAAIRGERPEDRERFGDTAETWLRLWRNARRQLPSEGRRILTALEEDWRSRPAARKAGVSQPTVDRWKKIFKVRFAACYRAYRASRRG